MTIPDSLDVQRQFWNQWNTTHRETGIDETSLRQATIVQQWLEQSGRRDLTILEVGCGAGWLCPRLLPFGQVTGTDLSDEVLGRARQRAPEVNFIAGDFMKIEFAAAAFDAVVALEVLSHVADQPAFLARAASLLRPGGQLMLATQNKPVLEKYNRFPPPAPGQLRRWVDAAELRRLLTAEFEVMEIYSVVPRANRGIMRIVNSRTFNRPIRAVAGDLLDRAKEASGLGFTLMARALRP